MSCSVVVAHAHREQLHDLAAEILVGRPLHVLPGVEEHQHRRVLRHAHQQFAETAGGEALKQRELAEHLAIVANLVAAGGEVAVPEQRHLLFERPVGRDHAVRPPVGDPPRLQRARAQPEEEPVGDRLQPARPRRLHRDPHGHAGLRGEARGGGPGRREGGQRRVVDAGGLERLEVTVVDRVIVDQRRHRRGGGHAREPSDRLRRSAEAGAVEQVAGAGVVPVGLADRGEVLGPTVRRARPGAGRRGCGGLRWGRDRFRRSAGHGLPLRPHARQTLTREISAPCNGTPDGPPARGGRRCAPLAAPAASPDPGRRDGRGHGRGFSQGGARLPPAAAAGETRDRADQAHGERSATWRSPIPPASPPPAKRSPPTPSCARDYTARGNLVAVISNGTAVLGLGNIGALAGKPVMEGKAVLFKKFAGIDVFDIEVDETDPDRFCDVVAALEPTFGAINLEDIKAPECFEIEERSCARAWASRSSTTTSTAPPSPSPPPCATACCCKASGSRRCRLVTSGAGAAAMATRRSAGDDGTAAGGRHADRHQGRGPRRARGAGRTHGPLCARHLGADAGGSAGRRRYLPRPLGAARAEAGMAGPARARSR